MREIRCRTGELQLFAANLSHSRRLKTPLRSKKPVSNYKMLSTGQPRKREPPLGLGCRGVRQHNTIKFSGT